MPGQKNSESKRSSFHEPRCVFVYAEMKGAREIKPKHDANRGKFKDLVGNHMKNIV